VDMVTFTSSSTVRNFLTMLDAASEQEVKTLLKDVKIAAIGPITAKTITDNGLVVDAQPEEHTIEAMVDSIVAYFSEKGRNGE